MAEDSDYLLFTVVLFRRVIDSFKTAARAAGYQVKDPPPRDGPAGTAGAAEASDRLRRDAEAKRAALEQWCITSYGEVCAGLLRAVGLDRSSGGARLSWAGDRLARRGVTPLPFTPSPASAPQAFSSWIHILAVRLFVESILRYGLPPQFLPVLMRPAQKTAAKLRKLMAQNFGGVGAEHFAEGGGPGEGDLFPYVCFALSIEEHTG